jgi:hypothetical protein
MATDRDNKAGRAHEAAQGAKEGLLHDVGLLALPVLAFQRNMLKLVKKGIEEAGLLKPVRTLAEHELQALFMILDPTGKFRNSRAEIEEKMRDAFDKAVPKVIEGSVHLIDAHHDFLTKLIEALETERKSQTTKGAKK